MWRNIERVLPARHSGDDGDKDGDTQYNLHVDLHRLLSSAPEVKKLPKFTLTSDLLLSKRRQDKKFLSYPVKKADKLIGQWQMSEYCVSA